jgi:hypothetical protein
LDSESLRVSSAGPDRHTGDIVTRPAVPELVAPTGVGAVVGANELDTRADSPTYFNAQLYFTPEHGFVGSHRKLVPTVVEISAYIMLSVAVFIAAVLIASEMSRKSLDRNESDDFLVTG